MKKAAFIGVIVLIAGFILSVVGFAMLDGDYTALEMETSYALISFGGNSKTVEQTFSPESLERIDINSISTDIKLGYSDDGLIHVTGPENALEKISYENGVLTVTAQKKIRFRLFQINFSGVSGVITVLIPEDFVPDAAFSTVSGDIQLTVTALGDASLSSTSGDILIGELTAASLSCSTVSGGIRLGRAEAGRVELGSTSGDVKFDRLSAETSLSLSTVSGDVNGTLAGDPEDYTREISTVSGGMSIHSGGSGPIKLTVSTVSGDIRLEFAGK